MEHRKKSVSSGLRIRLMLFTTILAVITYSTSAFFIYVIYDYAKEFVNHTLYNEVILTLGVAWSGALAYFAADFLIKPLRLLEEAAQKAAEGDIRHDVPLPKANDEIRSLSIAFNRMLYNLRGIVQNIETTFSHTNSQVQQIRSQTSEAAQQAREVSGTIQEISSGTEQSAATIEEIVSTVHTTVALVGQVEDQARQAEDLSAQMVHSLKESTAVFSALIQGIQVLVQENEQSMAHVQQLEEHTKQAGHIVSVVREIATQTNLLALNASIEAARAGEHGRGFAVVAEEVRKLADESAASTKGIADLLHNMQSEVQFVVQHMKEQVKTAKEKADSGEATANLLREMSGSIMQVAGAIAQISSYMQEQTRHIQHVGLQTKEVAHIAKETSAGTQEMSQATIQQSENISLIDELAGNLEAHAMDLKRTIERFTV